MVGLNLSMAQYSRHSDQDMEEEGAMTPTSEVLSDPSGGAVRFMSPSIKYRVRSTSIWTGRTSVEKWLSVSLVVMSFACLLLLVMVASMAGKDRQFNVTIHTPHAENMTDICLSEDCVKVAAKILTAADLKQDPCQDFYQYSCGNWAHANPIPDGKSRWSTFDKLWQDNQRVMRDLLEREDGMEECPSCVKAKNYYESCLDRNGSLEVLKGMPLREILSSFYWNVTDFAGSTALDENVYSLQEVMQNIQVTFNVDMMFSWSVGEDDKNSSRHILQIDQSGLTLPTRDYYLTNKTDDPVVAALLTVMVKTSSLLYQEKHNKSEVDPYHLADLTKEMADVINFEKQLANITIPADSRRDNQVLYNKHTISSLQKISPFLNWTEYFQTSFNKIHRPITEDELIIVYAPTYLKHLSDIVTEMLETKEGRNTLNNYMIWQLIKSLSSSLSKAYRDAYNILRTALVGLELHEERWRLCVTEVDNVLGFALGSLFVKKTFDGKSKPDAENMIREVKDAFINILKEASWMDDETRAKAEEKAEKITNMVGYPDYIVNKTALTDKYAKLEITRDYFGNAIKFNKWNLIETLQKLDKPVDKMKWGMTPPTINAYYAPTKNQIVFPAGILQSPFFSHSFPKSVNFGGMGVVVGHEVSHAFDDSGREYDETGNMKQWWANSTLEKFRENVHCMEEQYSNFTINGENINGKQTVGENIADNGGLKASYNAYLTWLAKNGGKDGGKLPGLNLTDRQLFFLSFGQVWCTTSTAQADHLQLKEDPHTPPQYRVIGTLANFGEFAKEFECKKGTPMNPNPEDKCIVW